MSLTNDQITAKNFKAFYERILPYLNGAAHSGFTPIGTVISVMGTTAPLNYLACDGTAYNISDYPELAAYFNTQFGSSNFFGGNGTTTFAVPDLRGEFLRGTGTNSHANQGSGANVGVHQDGTKQLNMFSNDTEIYFGVADIGVIGNEIDYGSPNKSTVKYSNVNGTSIGSNFNQYFTSRPTNTSVLYCIASKNIFMDAGSNYSTEEQVVGTWIDSKPIYQKTVIGTVPSSTGEVDIALSNDADLCFVTNCIVTNENGYTANMSFASDLGIDIKNTGKLFFSLSGNNFNGRPFIATIQYTKTTD